MAETIQISLNEIPTASMASTGSSNKSVNFGPGADLLMNPNKQKKSEGMASDIVLDDLNELSTISLDPEPPKKITTTKSSFLFSGTDFGGKKNDNNIKLNVEPVHNPTAPT